jgi:hypothetical protein
MSARFVEETPPGYMPRAGVHDETGRLGPKVFERVKLGDLDALFVRRGRRKGLRIKVVGDQPGLFHE